jgi:hypothetical protein
MKKLFALFGVALLATLILAWWMDYDREWKKYQQSFFQMQLAKAETEQEKQAVREQAVDVKAYWLEEIDLVDRCITCHLGINEPRFKSAPQPYTTHPAIAEHPFDEFGCTLCHQGQGRATTVEAAHGDVERWPEPMLKGVYLQSACARCHAPHTLTAAPVLMTGALAFDQFGCRACHKIAGRGGDIGPDLTRIGHLSIEYLKESIVDPKANDPNSIMPKLPLPPDKVQALVVYMLSLKGQKPLPGLMPPPKAPAPAPTPTPAPTSASE